jgi:hypothetical protein
MATANLLGWEVLPCLREEEEGNQVHLVTVLMSTQDFSCSLHWLVVIRSKRERIVCDVL